MQIKNYLPSVMAENREKLNTKIIVEGHIAKVREAICTLQHNLDILLRSITNARQGILQP
jgi:hypothetical protein